MLEAEQILKIFHCIDSTFGVGRSKETTIECNPDDIRQPFLETLRATPVNRISMGIQSFDDRKLKLIGRRHTADDAKRAVRLCQDSGFGNISIDLIYGLPGQTVEEFVGDIHTAIALGVTHISAYCLSYEEGTPLTAMLKKGTITPVSDDDCALMYDALCETMRSHGYTHYEISNFALPGYRSIHNSNYWNGTPYIGIGAAAHSFNGTERKWNISDLDRYTNGILSGHPETGSEQLTPDDRYNEMIMLALRTSDGLDLRRLDTEFGAGTSAAFLSEAGVWIKKGDLIHIGGTVRFNESGLFRSDGITASLFR